MWPRLSASIEDYATGKKWYWYLPLWLMGLYAYFELFQFDMAVQQMPLVLIVPYSFNFVMHEIAHIAVAFLPPVLVAAAGSGSELLLGTLLVVMALLQRSYFALLYCALWFALSCQSAGQYMADAVPRQIPLVSLGGALSGQDAKHDWNFVFGQLHLLGASGFIGMALRVFGMAVAAAALAFTGWVMYKMPNSARWQAAKEEPKPSSGPLLPDDGVFAPARTPAKVTGHDEDPPPTGASDSFS